MKKILCGIDLGGTKLSVALVTSTGIIIDKKTTCNHVGACCDGIVEIMVSFLQELLQKNYYTYEHLCGIGVAFPGHIKSKEGVCITTSNLSAGFENYPLKQKLEDFCQGVPVYTENDANAQAYAEYRFGAGKGYNNMVFVTLSTGIGAGVIINGSLLRGKHGTAGELGHTIINDHSKRRCTCGNYGCLMTEASGLFLGCMAIDWICKGVNTQLSITENNAQQVVSGELIKKGLEIDDPLALAVMYESANAVGTALYNVFQLFNPDIIVLGGGLLNWGQPYLDRIRGQFHKGADSMLGHEVKIVQWQMGTHAGVVGASALPLENM